MNITCEDKDGVMHTFDVPDDARVSESTGTPGYARKGIRIEICNGMVDINSDRVSYGNIRNMYQGNINGGGVQVAEGVDEKKVGEICDKIAELIYLLQDELHRGA